VPDDVRASFLGDNLAECFARVGDPIVEPVRRG
jgi:hypothetical protein